MSELHSDRVSYKSHDADMRIATLHALTAGKYTVESTKYQLNPRDSRETKGKLGNPQSDFDH